MVWCVLATGQRFKISIREKKITDLQFLILEGIVSQWYLLIQRQI